jgi:hypothetical protein
MAMIDDVKLFQACGIAFVHAVERQVEAMFEDHRARNDCSIPVIGWAHGYKYDP